MWNNHFLTQNNKFDLIILNSAITLLTCGIKDINVLCYLYLTFISFLSLPSFSLSRFAQINLLRSVPIRQLVCTAI